MVFNKTVYVVDDEEGVRTFIQIACGCLNCEVTCFPSADGFLKHYEDAGEFPRCLILDIDLPGMSGLELHRQLVESRALIPVILLTGMGNVATAVKSLQRGAVDFLEKPVSLQALRAIVERGLALDLQQRIDRKLRQSFAERLQTLSRREHDVFEHLKACRTNKQIASLLGIGFQTAAKHTSSVLRKLNVANELEFMQSVTQAEAPSQVENLANGGGKTFAGERFAQ